MGKDMPLCATWASNITILVNLICQTKRTFRLNFKVSICPTQIRHSLNLLPRHKRHRPSGLNLFHVANTRICYILGIRTIFTNIYSPNAINLCKIYLTYSLLIAMHLLYRNNCLVPFNFCAGNFKRSPPYFFCQISTYRGK